MRTLMLTVVMLAGCCTARHPETNVSIDSYVQVIRQTKTNLTDDIRPALDTALGEPENAAQAAQKQAKLNLIDDTVALLDGALQGAKKDEAK